MLQNSLCQRLGSSTNTDNWRPVLPYLDGLRGVRDRFDHLSPSGPKIQNANRKFGHGRIGSETAKKEFGACGDLRSAVDRHFPDAGRTFER
jgi:hypothetical protein